jgi:AraC-like DNA-binding protein
MRGPHWGVVGDTLIQTADLLLRGGACLLLAVLAALVLREHGRVAAGWLGALFAAGSAAFTLCSAPGMHDLLGWWSAPILAAASGNNLVFWLFARALFVDGFRPRLWHGALWLAIVAAAVIEVLVLEPTPSAPVAPLMIALVAQTMLFAVLGGVQAVATWRGDLVEPRRRLRLFVVAATAAYIVVNAGTGILQIGISSHVRSLLQIAVLIVILVTVAAALLRVSGEAGLFPEPAARPRDVAERAAAPPDPAQVAALERVMSVDRAYRQEGLSIGRLALRLGLPEYRLRQLINQGLGYRNFASFLSFYRIAEAKAALADPAQAEVPILTIALDAGFNSLGPFNRAFKAETGMTPSEFRRQRPPAAARRVAEQASRISNPA